MVLQIIKSSRTSRSAILNHAIRNLTLDLSPVYNNWEWLQLTVIFIQMIVPKFLFYSILIYYY